MHVNVLCTCIIRYSSSLSHCRAHVHTFTIVQFLGVMSNIHTVLDGQQHVYCIHGNNGLENSYSPIPRFVCNIEPFIPRAFCPRDSCFYTSYRLREMVNNCYWKHNKETTRNSCLLNGVATAYILLEDMYWSIKDFLFFAAAVVKSGKALYMYVHMSNCWEIF